MFALLSAADIFLSASRTEAFSYAILEAISQNVPVVASDISGTRWCLKYSKSFKYPAEDYEACADAIIKASKIRGLPSNGDKIVDKYNIDIWCDRVLNVYNKMLK
jgi:glycosyltransferase involved in cell wall biosynthesis